MSEPDSALQRALAWLRQIWDQAPPTLRRRWPWFIAGGALLGAIIVVLVRWGSHDDIEGPTAQDSAVVEGAAVEGAAGASTQEATPPGLSPIHPPERTAPVDAGPPLSPNVKLTFRTFPPRRATVTWGSKRLGFIDRGKPLVVERVRDSGPLDVIVRAQGYIPVHARAYTFNDANVDVKITPIEKKDTIYGYQQPLGDAGAPIPPAL